MSNLGKGWVRDFHSEHDVYFGALRLKFGDSLVLKSASIRDLVGTVRNQLSTSTCVGQAIVRAAHLWLLANGYVDAKYGSALDVYANARSYERSSPDVPFVDAGCLPRDAMIALQALGYVAEEDMPFSEADVNKEPSWDVTQRAAVSRVDGFYRIGGDGQARCDAIAEALSNKHPVVFGMEVDQAYEDMNAGDVYPGLTGKSLGGHMQCLVGFDTMQSGDRVFQLVNSWGGSWCDSGFADLSEKAMGDPRSVSDLYAFTMVPQAAP